MRVLHFSDVHVHFPVYRVPLRDWWGRRLWSGIPVALRRGGRFYEAAEKLAALFNFSEQNSVQLALCSGDMSELGTKRELEVANRALDPFRRLEHGLVTIPGNHDVYYSGGHKRYLTAFPNSLGAAIPAEQTGPDWPFVRLFGGSVALIAVNAVSAKPPGIGATGEIDSPQLEALDTLLHEPQLRNRFIFVILHYTPQLADGSPDWPGHRLNNAEEFLEVCAGGRRGAILAGHVHELFCRRAPETPLPIFCAGSATEDGREGAWLIDVKEEGAAARQVRWDGDKYYVTPEPAVHW